MDRVGRMVGNTLPTRSVSRGTRVPREIPLTRNGVNLFAGLWLPGRNGTQFCQLDRYFAVTTPAKFAAHTARAGVENFRNDVAVPLVHHWSIIAPACGAVGLGRDALLSCVSSRFWRGSDPASTLPVRVAIRRPEGPCVEGFPCT